MNVSITKRDFSGPALTPGVRWKVESLTWRAVGGPWSAKLIAKPDTSGLTGLWRLLELLRCGVTVFDELGAAWWGYIAGVEIRAGTPNGTTQPVLRASLDEMSNRVVVRYRDYAPTPGGGAAQITEWVTDDASIAAYGRKEQAFQMAAASADGAAAFARAVLGKVGQLVVTSSVSAASTSAETAGPYAVIEARGWWETLDWVYANETRNRLANEAGGSQQRIGDTAASTKIAQAIVPGGWYMREAWLKVGRSLATDNLVVSILSSAGGLPGGVLASASLAASKLQDSIEWVCVPLVYSFAAGTSYFLQVARSEAVQSGKYFTVSVDAGKGYSDGAMLVYNGSAWVARSPDADLTFVLLGQESTTANISFLMRAALGGQFFSSVRMEASSTVNQVPYRSDFQRVRAVVEDLLVADGAGGRLLARVEPDRTARVYPQPAQEWARLVVGADGQVRQADGRPLAPSEFPAGQWARLGALTEGGGARPAVFIEQCAWQEGKGWRVG